MSKTADQFISEIQALLSGYYTPSEADTWWGAPHPQFDGKSALDMVEQGRGQDVVDALRRLDDAGYL